MRFAETIVSSGNDLLTLINDVLDLAKIDAGKIEIAPETVDLPRLLDWVKAMFEPVAQGEAHRVRGAARRGRAGRRSPPIRSGCARS